MKTLKWGDWLAIPALLALAILVGTSIANAAPHLEEGMSVRLVAWCEANDDATGPHIDYAQMRRILIAQDVDAYVALMKDPKTQCGDVRFYGLPPLPSRVGEFLERFGTDDGKCLDIYSFTAAGKVFYSWVPVDSDYCAGA